MAVSWNTCGLQESMGLYDIYIPRRSSHRSNTSSKIALNSVYFLPFLVKLHAKPEYTQPSLTKCYAYIDLSHSHINKTLCQAPPRARMRGFNEFSVEIFPDAVMRENIRSSEKQILTKQTPSFRMTLFTPGGLIVVKLLRKDQRS